MPDLGKYAFEVLTAYGVSLFLIAALVWGSWRRFARVRRELQDMESKHG